MYEIDCAVVVSVKIYGCTRQFGGQQKRKDRSDIGLFDLVGCTFAKPIKPHAAGAGSTRLVRLEGDVVWNVSSLNHSNMGSDPIEAEALMNEGLELARELRMQPEEAHALRVLGDIAAANGKSRAVRENRDRAQAIYQSLGMTYWLERLG